MQVSKHTAVYKNSTITNWKAQNSNMETPTSLVSLSSLPLNSTHSTSHLHFNTLFSHLNSILISPKTQKSAINNNTNNVSFSPFLCTSISMESKLQKPTSKISPKSTINNNDISVFERAFIGACAGGSAGAFTYFCLHPLDTIKTKLQMKGASQIYKNTLDAIVKTFQTKGISGFYSGISAVIVGSAFSSALLFGTCEFGKSFILSKFENYPSLLIPPTAGVMGNIVSSAIMVPKELITQRMQAGAKGKSWEIFLQILQKEGVLGLYTGYSATLLRNLPAGVLSYSSFEWLKTAVLKKEKKEKLTPLESICCGALAGAISASLTTPLDVIKTRLMTQFHGSQVAAVMYSGISATVKQILMEDGLVGFSRGMGARVVHSACFSAIGYFAFETARLAILDQFLKHKNHQSNNEIMALDPSS